MILQSMFR